MRALPDGAGAVRTHARPPDESAAKPARQEVGGTAAAVLLLQRRAGNRAVAGLLGRPERRVARNLLTPLDDTLREAHKLVGFGVKAVASFVPADGTSTTDRRTVDVTPLDLEGAPTAIPIAAGARGFLTVTATAEAKTAGLPPRSSIMTASETWEIISGRSGALTIRKLVDDRDKGRDEPTLHGDLTADAHVNLKGAEAVESNDTRRAELALTFSGPGFESGKETKEKGLILEGGIEKKGIGGKATYESDEVTRKQGFTNPAAGERWRFVVEVVLTGVEQPAPPPLRPTPPKPRGKRRNEWRLWFGPGQSSIVDKERLYLSDWWEHAVHAETKDKLGEGQAVLHIDSYADATDTVEKNEILARGRQTAVEDILRGELGTPIKWASEGIHGENQYATDDKQREAREPALRRSVIWCEETIYDDVPTQVTQLGETRRAEEEAAIKRQRERSVGGGNR